MRYRRVTYRELDDDSGRLAAGFGRLGLGPGSRVAVGRAAQGAPEPIPCGGAKGFVDRGAMFYDFPA